MSEILINKQGDNRNFKHPDEAHHAHSNGEAAETEGVGFGETTTTHSVRDTAVAVDIEPSASPIQIAEIVGDGRNRDRRGRRRCFHQQQQTSGRS